MNEIKETGGARIGMANASYPFATLKVSKEKLELNASIIGNLVFRPVDVVSIIPHSGFLSQGLKIIHRIPNYADHVIFWTSSDSKELLKRIEKTGFLTNTSPLPTSVESEILTTQSTGGIPVKVPAIVLFAVIWNILLLSDFINFLDNDKHSRPFGVGSLLALGFAFLTGILILIAEPFRKLILKEGRTLSDIRAFVYLMMFVSGLMILSIVSTG